MLDALEGKLSPNAVNAPMVPAEVGQADLHTVGSLLSTCRLFIYLSYFQFAWSDLLYFALIVTGNAHCDLNTPNIGPKVLQELQPYISLAEGLGKAAVSLVAEE